MKNFLITLGILSLLATSGQLGASDTPGAHMLRSYSTPVPESRRVPSPAPYGNGEGRAVFPEKASPQTQASSGLVRAQAGDISTLHPSTLGFGLRTVGSAKLNSERAVYASQPHETLTPRRAFTSDLSIGRGLDKQALRSASAPTSLRPAGLAGLIESLGHSFTSFNEQITRTLQEQFGQVRALGASLRGVPAVIEKKVRDAGVKVQKQEQAVRQSQQRDIERLEHENALKTQEIDRLSAENAANKAAAQRARADAEAAGKFRQQAKLENDRFRIQASTALENAHKLEMTVAHQRTEITLLKEKIASLTQNAATNAQHTMVRRNPMATDDDYFESDLNEIAQ